MEEIYEPNNDFDFKKLSLAPPTILSGGNYFIKFHINGNPLYIQPPKCTTKQGIIKAGKKMYCDLMMTNQHELFIQWMENLENYSQDMIYNNREKWFETSLEKHDIENSFSSPVKTYKSGKYYITRTNVPTRLGKCILKIYDENEEDVNIETIKEDTNLITILEVQGIKCSARSFQIEIELKQMMVLKPSILFEKCIIKSRVPVLDSKSNSVDADRMNSSNHNDKTNMPDNLGEISHSDLESVPPVSNQLDSLSESIQPVNSYDTHEENDSDMSPPANESYPNISIKIDEPLNETPKINSNEMTEVVFDLDKVFDSDIVKLKTRNDVYYTMYREAKKKAKQARELAIASYLEAKHIKNTYMLEEINDSDDDDENENEGEDGLDFNQFIE